MAVHELLYRAMSSLISPNDSQFLQFLVPFFIMFVVVFVLRTSLEDIYGDFAGMHPLLVFYFMSFPMWNHSTKNTGCLGQKKKPEKEEPPVVSEPLKKKPLKEKRKRKKAVDKDNKDSTRVDVYRNPVQTKMYSTLPLYEELKKDHSMDDRDLYYEFGQYLLTPEQLAKNDFPLECPENPGQVISRCKKFRQDPTSRTCSRCYQTFHIAEGDEYISETLCYYHTTRCDVGYHACCSGAYGSRGCSWSQCHVSSEPALDNVIFKRVEGKRQVREDQSLKVYALDCEMLFTTIGMEVAKVGLVDLEGKTVYQTFVLPEHPILDYNTQFSGITANDLKGITITLADVQNFLLRTLNKNTILVGHALQNDLRVLRIIHEKIVDTQVVFHQGNYRKKLKALALEYLKKSIQDSEDGHDSIEDARACMELMLWKIRSDLERRPPVKQNEKDSLLQNGSPPSKLYIPQSKAKKNISQPDRLTHSPFLHQNIMNYINYPGKKYFSTPTICGNCTPRNSFSLNFEQFSLTDFCDNCVYIQH